MNPQPKASGCSAVFRAGDYECAYRDFLSLVVQVVTNQDPLVGKIERRSLRHSGGSSNIVGGQEVVYHGSTLEAQLLVERADVLSSNIQKHIGEICKFGNQFVDGQAIMIFENLGKATAASGNSFDAGGQPLNHELLLSMLASMQWRFDELGEPVFDWTIVVSDPALEQTLRELLKTIENHKGFQEVKQRKREEWFLSQRKRRLRGVHVP